MKMFDMVNRTTVLIPFSFANKVPSKENGLKGIPSQGMGES
jgi:hypothetical protein